MARPYNFSAGPAAMPEAVLRQAAAEMLDWHGCGMGVMEMSHRGKHFGAILQQARDDLRTLLAVPEHFHILFSQGGALAHNAIVPLNLAGRHPARAMDFVVTGGWSDKSAKEARRYGDVHIAASSAEQGYTPSPTPPPGGCASAPPTCTCAATKPSTASSSTPCPIWPRLGAKRRW